jgi:sugar phosphate isomerase/epimerase
MGEYIGDDFNMVFDIKQSVRTGENPFEFAKLLHKYIRHIHISDHNSAKDCFVPCKNGTFDFKKFFDLMKGYDYKGDYILELYENGYESDNELTFALNELKKLL